MKKINFDSIQIFGGNGIKLVKRAGTYFVKALNISHDEAALNRYNLVQIERSLYRYYKKDEEHFAYQMENGTCIDIVTFEPISYKESHEFKKYDIKNHSARELQSVERKYLRFMKWNESRSLAHRQELLENLCAVDLIAVDTDLLKNLNPNQSLIKDLWSYIETNGFHAIQKVSTRKISYIHNGTAYCLKDFANQTENDSKTPFTGEYIAYEILVAILTSSEDNYVSATGVYANMSCDLKDILNSMENVEYIYGMWQAFKEKNPTIIEERTAFKKSCQQKIMK